LLTDFVCLYIYEFWLFLCKIVRSSVILLLPLFPFVVITIPSFPHSQDTTEFATRGTTASVTSGAEHYYPPGAPEFIPVFCWFRVAQIFSFLCSVFHFVVCFFFVPFLLAIVLSVLRFTDCFWVRCDLCLFAYGGVLHILCSVFDLFLFVLCTLWCQFLWIVLSWLPLRYYVTFIWLPLFYLQTLFPIIPHVYTTVNR
jgi:hypothetical protein